MLHIQICQDTTVGSAHDSTQLTSAFLLTHKISETTGLASSCQRRWYALSCPLLGRGKTGRADGAGAQAQRLGKRGWWEFLETAEQGEEVEGSVELVPLSSCFCLLSSYVNHSAKQDPVQPRICT